ncbi:amidohydrolase family protein [Solicola gregarius]|uniref:Amidohydrolase n=1 Tax=Solicola gregarius TaxID=2908642 RepID=A0AA46TGF8_9ACTN|nr:amidohydrolase family protein [Solicola gregarius]UYM04088.1 amidohydrolase [Solicola gregarius]
MIDPADDVAHVRAWVDALGLPGLFDAHVHFMPAAIMDRVWAHFDERGPLIGRPWPIRYRGSDDERLATLRSFGVRRFSALPYAHKPGVADFLNGWARDFAERHDEVLWSATFYPEPSAGSYVEGLIEDGAEIFKVHVQVGDFDPRDALLDPVWAALADSETPVVVHAGSGPVAGRHTGAGPIGEVLSRHPRLPMVVAHMGAPEYADFLVLAEKYERVRLDTTMAFTDFFDAEAPYPADLLPRLHDLEPRVLLGSDFPNIPYSYAHQLEALERLGLGDDWLRSVCWQNAVELFGLRR